MPDARFEGRKYLLDDWSIHPGDIIDYELHGLCRIEAINHYSGGSKFVLKVLFTSITIEVLGMGRIIRVTDESRLP